MQFRINLNNTQMKILHIILIFALLIGCDTTEKKPQEVNLYSQRHYKVDEKQYENFTKKTGIKVNYIKANADELLERLKNEGKKQSCRSFRFS